MHQHADGGTSVEAGTYDDPSAMSTIVELTVPADQFALQQTLERVPEAEFDVVRMTASGTESVMPFIWATADDLDALHHALEDDPSTTSVEVLGELEDQSLLRMDWRAKVRVFVCILLEEDATIVEATAEHGRWYFRVLFPKRDSVSAANESCQKYDIDLQVERVNELTDSFHQGQFGLSDAQFEAIVRAYETGYYRVPRQSNLEELANQMGVSHQALSERLRRGHERLIQNGLRPRNAVPADN